MEFQRVLVLGATGRIGTILQTCWGPDTGPAAVRWQGRNPPRADGAQADADGAQADRDWAVLDPLAAPAALAAAADGCGAILCLAGVTPARAQRGGAMKDNSALAEAAVCAAGPGTRVLLASSAAVYGRQSGLLAETTTPAPVSDYGRAKAAMEMRAAALGRDLGVPVTALRIGNIAGADAILGGWRPGFQLDRFADGRTPRRSYIGPVTLARVLADLLAASNLPDLPGVLNLAAPGVVEMGALLEAAGRAWAPRPAPDDAIAEVRLDVRALQRFSRLSDRDSLAAALVAEWRASEPEIAGTDPL